MSGQLDLFGEEEPRPMAPPCPITQQACERACVGACVRSMPASTYSREAFEYDRFGTAGPVQRVAGVEWPAEVGPRCVLCGAGVRPHDKGGPAADHPFTLRKAGA